MPLLGGKRGCCLGQLPDPGVQVAAAVVCGVPVVVVTLGRGGRGVGAPADSSFRFRFPAAALIPWHA